MNSSISSFKRKLVLHLSLFALFLLACPPLSSYWLRQKYGPGTGEQIGQAFQRVQTAPAFDTVLLGNSRIYRGLNPERWGNSYNFAHDGDSWNQMYYKLLHLQQAGKLPRRLVLGLDYFSFSQLDSSRIEFYQKFFPPAFARDYWVAPPPQRFGESLNLAGNAWMDRHFFQVFPLLFQPGETVQRTLSASGQYRIQADPKRPYLRSVYNPVRRDSRRLPVLVDYFRRSLTLARQQHIPVTLVMPPCNLFERQAYTEANRRDFWSFVAAEKGQARVISFETDARFHLRDYQDFTHLKLEAADRFSDLVWARMVGADRRPARGNRPIHFKRTDR